jgi:hypothetical protein
MWYKSLTRIIKCPSGLKRDINSKITIQIILECKKHDFQLWKVCYTNVHFGPECSTPKTSFRPICHKYTTVLQTNWHNATKMTYIILKWEVTHILILFSKRKLLRSNRMAVLYNGVIIISNYLSQNFSYIYIYMYSSLNALHKPTFIHRFLPLWLHIFWGINIYIYIPYRKIIFGNSTVTYMVYFATAGLQFIKRKVKWFKYK